MDLREIIAMIRISGDLSLTETSQTRCITYLDRDGRAQEIEADGILATCLQHEIDHLNGVCSSIIFPG